MNNKIECIMLIDDNPHDNFFHERAISQYDAAIKVLKMESGADALDYLESSTAAQPAPDVIFLDINMPHMNGWDFLEEYKRKGMDARKKAVIVMLTTSENPSERKMAVNSGVVSDFLTKPLTHEALEGLGNSFF